MSNSKKNKNQTKLRPYAVMCTDLYLLWILMVYPLYYADGYFHLPEKKATFWCVSTIIYLGVTLFGVVIAAFSDREQWTLENIRKNISMTDIFMFGFLISNLIAFALSEDKVNAWTGASSRYYGAKVLILVCLVYFVVSRYAWINKIFIWAFLIGGNVVCLLATLDYFWYDVLGINQQMVEWDWMNFISTMGNVNTCASYVCMSVSASLVYFCIATNIKDKIISAISLMNCTVALVTSRSDSPFVGVAVVIVVLGIFSIMKVLDVKKYILMLGVVDLTFVLFFGIRHIFRGRLRYTWWESGIPAILNQPKMLFIALGIIVLIYILLTVNEKKKIIISKEIKVIGLVVCTVLCVCVMIWGMNKFEIESAFVEALQGNRKENVAGSRRYTYDMVLKTYLQLPLWNKLFGCGQGALSRILNFYYGQELNAAGISINSAHNNVLDYLMIGGIAGAICYIGIVFSSIKDMLKVTRIDKKVLVIGGCIIGYFAQGIFNIEQTNTTPIFWLFIALISAMCKQVGNFDKSK